MTQRHRKLSDDCIPNSQQHRSNENSFIHLAQFPKRLLSSMAKEGKFDVFSDFRLNCFQLKIL